MKKILTFLLATALIFAFVSCNTSSTPPADDSANSGNQTENENTDSTTQVSIVSVQNAINASTPATADVSVIYDSKAGVLAAEYDVVYNADGSSTVNYTYETFNTIDPDDPDAPLKSENTGVVTIASDGTVTGNLGNGIVSVKSLNNFNITLDESKITVSKLEAGILNAEIKSADTEAVLGYALDSDVTLTINTADLSVKSIILMYKTSDEETVKVTSIYGY